jgi:hypothetical protein
MNSAQGKVARFETQLEDYDGFIPMGMEECIELNMLPSLYKPTDSEIPKIEAIRIKMKGSQAATAQQSQVGSSVSPSTMNVGAMPPPPPPISQYYVLDDNRQQTGPFTLPYLQQMVAQGLLKRQSYVWKEGMANWSAAELVSELTPLFMMPSPPPPPPML